MAEFGFTFAGRGIAARPGQTVAAALTEAGERVLRVTAKGAERGIFCGMGVCQDCLVTVDGVPNRRACMTAAEPGMAVEPQAAFAALGAPPARQPAPARRIEPDVLIVGGGAAGLNAAIAAAQAGASVVLLDERKAGGGQFYKQTATGEAPLDRQQADGAALEGRAAAAGVEIVRGAEVWGAFEGPLLTADAAGRALVARPRSLVVATGAYERPCMVPGWTLPGVMTTGAAQTLWRSYRSLAGRRVAICGSGPLNVQVAGELARGGAHVVLVAEAAASPLAAPRAALALVAAGPRLAARGVAMLSALRRLRVPVRFGWDLERVEPSEGGLAATFIDARGSRSTVHVDALCMNAGFEPQNEILRLLGARMRYDPVFGHLRCERDETMATSVERVWAAGDCAGLGGAPAAEVEGRIAGRAAAAAAGHGSGVVLEGDRRERDRHHAFQERLWALYRPQPRPTAALADDTIVCRCEEITVGTLRSTLDDDPTDAGTIKRATRLGMGRCQGRYCGPVAVRLLAETRGSPITDLSHFAPRVPVKPVAIASIVDVQEALDGQE